jgi:hypothetical protein
MGEPPVTTSFVSQVAPVAFADAVDVADVLAGRELTAGSARLAVGRRIGDGLAGAVWYEGTLHTGSVLLPATRVDIVVSPWSAGRVEVGIRPLRRLGGPHSLRAARFFRAAWAVLPELIATLSATAPATAPAPAAAAVPAAA